MALAQLSQQILPPIEPKLSRRTMPGLSREQWIGWQHGRCLTDISRITTHLLSCLPPSGLLSFSPRVQSSIMLYPIWATNICKSRWPYSRWCCAQFWWSHKPVGDCLKVLHLQNHRHLRCGLCIGCWVYFSTRASPRLFGLKDQVSGKSLMIHIDLSPCGFEMINLTVL